MAKFSAIFFALICSFFAAKINAGKVLMMPSTLFPSHRFIMRELAGELVKRGHEVVWWEYRLDTTGSDIRLPEGVEERSWTVKIDDPVINELFLYRNHSSYDRLWDSDYKEMATRQSTAWLASIEMCRQILENRKLDFDLLAKETFDTIVLDDLYNPCGLVQAALHRSVYIYWSLTALRTESAWANQSPSPPSYIPVPGTGLTDELTFWQRAYNLASYLKAIYIHQQIVLPAADRMLAKYYTIDNSLVENEDYFGGAKSGDNHKKIKLEKSDEKSAKNDAIPELFYIERNASINYVNTPPIFDFARPYMPRVNFVGGLQCRKAAALTGDLAKFVDSANDQNGFVLFASGFSVQWKRAPERIINSFLAAFKARSDISFVWQYDGPKMNGLPKNVFISEWLPQQDLLGHNKCRAFISTGGLNSVIESIWHGVPILGLPLTAQGRDNLLRAATRGCGFSLDPGHLNEKTILKAIRRIYNEQFKEEVLVFQDLVTDVPYTELNHSAFWVEFIMRHQEVPHARSGADHLNILQYFLVDVLSFMLSMLFLFCLCFYYALKFGIRGLVLLFRAIFRLIRGCVNWLLKFGSKSPAKSRPKGRNGGKKKTQ